MNAAAAAAAAATPAARKDRLLEVSGVSVSFDGFKAINNLSFSIGKAELRAVIGPNGAGKTTFMDIVTGKERGFLLTMWADIKGHIFYKTDNRNLHFVIFGNGL